MAATWSPVADLEDGGDGEEGNGGSEDGGVRGEEAGEPVRDGEVDGRTQEHDDGGEGEGGPAGSAGSEEVAGADVLADADGGGRGKAHRDHEGEGDAVEGDLIAGERDGAEGRDQEGDDGKDEDLDENRCAGWNAEGEEAYERGAVELARGVFPGRMRVSGCTRRWRRRGRVPSRRGRGWWRRRSRQPRSRASRRRCLAAPRWRTPRWL